MRSRFMRAPEGSGFGVQGSGFHERLFDSGQELTQCLIDLFRLLHWAEVAGAFDDDEFGVGDGFVHRVGDGGRSNRIGIADDDERGNSHGGAAVAEVVAIAHGGQGVFDRLWRGVFGMFLWLGSSMVGGLSSVWGEEMGGVDWDVWLGSHIETGV